MKPRPSKSFSMWYVAWLIKAIRAFIVKHGVYDSNGVYRHIGNVYARFDGITYYGYKRNYHIRTFR